MCGRFTLTTFSGLTQAFPWITPPEDETAPRFNVAPSQPILAALNANAPQFAYLKWGLVPSWAKDPAVGNRMINARAETLAEKPAFRSALRRRRCLIPADGFYEWRKEGKAKTPMYIRMKSGEPFAFAGLWEAWHAPDGSELRSCTIITTSPNELMEKIHDRMPAILPAAAQRQWLEPGEAAEGGTLLGLLKPYPAKEMEAYAVSRLVNSPANDAPACVEPAEAIEPQKPRGNTSLFEPGTGNSA